MNSKLGDSNLPNWKQSAEAIETDQEQKIDDNTKRINDLETKTHYPMLNIDDLETEDAYITTLNVASVSNLHDVSADDVNCINCDVAGTLNAESVSDELINTLFKAIYPIGSIYVSTISYDPKPISSVFDTWTFDLHGCTFEMIKDTRFIRNVGYYVQASTGGRYSLELDLSPMSTGGSETHTHTTGNHTLTIDEIPSHAHEIWYYPKDTDRARTWGFKWERNGCVRNNEGCDAVGGGQAHNHGDTGSASNIPPYICLFVYRRIA